MKIVLDVKESLIHNAEHYFSLAKKQRKKAEHAREALTMLREKLEKKTPAPNKNQTTTLRKKQWFDAFRSTKLSSGKLVVGGKDAESNEVLIKKHVLKEDIVFHTEAPGSPFVVIKTGGSTVTEQDLEEAALFCAVYSRAWKQGLSQAEVYWVTPEQVSKEAKAGEYLQKGSFMIYGKRNFFSPGLRFALGVIAHEVIVGTEEHISSHCSQYVVLQPGETKTSDAAKEIAKHVQITDSNEVLRALPAGGVSITKKKGNILKRDVF
ncbi:MAG: DUF814 domain-containing protein [Candidatus Woesearchaeota archaeon]|nr:MAG: DUF814 domain-containing protein [Candidatus Woesearchaeota archaeon]